ncbi:MAG TPA: acyltransferase [Acidimicrobiales bacterium]|nr:acyltransferase [Acidimicrobiales bacterium]
MYAPSARQRRWGELEGWRIVAALGIVAIHVWQQVWGHHAGRPPVYHLMPYLQSLDLFVDLFFVVSGLVLTYPFVRALLDDPAGPAPSGFRGFLVQRFLRVAPVYYFVVVVVWSSRNFGFRTADWTDLVEHLTFTQWLDPKRIFYTIGPAWSVAVEFWMLPLIPLLFFAARPLARRLRRRGARAAVASVLPLLLVAVRVAFKAAGKAVWKVPYTEHAFWYSMPSKLDDFAIGMLLALLVALAGARRLPWAAGAVCRLAGAGGLAFIVAHRFHGSPVRYLTRFDDFEVACHPLAAVALGVLVLPALIGRRRGLVNRVVGARPLVAAGAFTYALYLVHEPLLQPLTSIGLLSTGASLATMARNWALVLPVALAAAVVMYLLIEWPMLRIRAAYDRSTGRSRDYYAHLADVVVTREGPLLSRARPARFEGQGRPEPDPVEVVLP